MTKTIEISASLEETQRERTEIFHISSIEMLNVCCHFITEQKPDCLSLFLTIYIFFYLTDDECAKSLYAQTVRHPLSVQFTVHIVIHTLMIYVIYKQHCRRRLIKKNYFKNKNDAIIKKSKRKNVDNNNKAIVAVALLSSA